MVTELYDKVYLLLESYILAENQMVTEHDTVICRRQRCYILAENQMVTEPR